MFQAKILIVRHFMIISFFLIVLGCNSFIYQNNRLCETCLTKDIAKKQRHVNELVLRLSNSNSICQPYLIHSNKHI